MWIFFLYVTNIFIDVIILAMEDNIKVTGLIIKTQDYKDFDKLATFITVERGKINAVFRGVKKPKAKMKMAAQPFCFGEYILSERGGNYIVINCTLTEAFYDLAYDADKYFTGCLMLEIINNITLEGEQYNALFIEALNVLKELTYGEADANLLAAKFILNALSFSGYHMTFSECASCGASVVKPYFSIDRGGVLCPLCADISAMAVTPRHINNMRFVDNTPYEMLYTIKVDKTASAKVLRFSAKIISEIYGFELKSLENISQ